MGDSNRESSEDHPNGSQSPSDPVQPQLTIHPITYSGMPMHMYPFPPGLVPSQPARTKRRQVKNACTNCQKACKKCDDARPCLRCVKYCIAEECIDSQRKERLKGVKRGPYKKRDGRGQLVLLSRLCKYTSVRFVLWVDSYRPFLRLQLLRRISNFNTVFLEESANLYTDYQLIRSRTYF